MKKLIFLFSVIILFPLFGFTQVIDSIDYISPFHEGFASIKKGNDWAIINEKGAIIIEYRDDLVSLKMKNGSYPIFNNGRSLIKQIKDDVIYFGYIDIKGNVVIEPQYINATNFIYDKAIVTKLIKYKLGYNNVIGKPVVSYKYQEIVIDLLGETEIYLTEQKPQPYLKPFTNISKINSKIISKDLVLTKNEKNKIILKKIE